MNCLVFCFLIVDIQKAYEKQTLSSDGQHLVPDGLQISQDIACITTFTSEIIQEPQELELFLGNIVKVSICSVCKQPVFYANDIF